MKYVRCIIVVFGILLLVGCGGNSSSSKTDEQAESLTTLLESQGEQDKKIQILENQLRGKEFRDFSMGIPIGEGGSLRIVNPTNDEGQPIYSPSQVLESFVDETNRMKRAANKKESDPPIQHPKMNPVRPKADGTAPAPGGPAT